MSAVDQVNDMDHLPVPDISIKDVNEAKRVLNGVAHRTPVMTCRSLNALLGDGFELFLKCENFQKVRTVVFSSCWCCWCCLCVHWGVRVRVCYVPSLIYRARWAPSNFVEHSTRSLTSRLLIVRVVWCVTMTHSTANTQTRVQAHARTHTN